MQRYYISSKDTPYATFFNIKFPILSDKKQKICILCDNKTITKKSTSICAICVRAATKSNRAEPESNRAATKSNRAGTDAPYD